MTAQTQNMPWIIETLLDTDLYKLTMLQAFYHCSAFEGADTEWKFKCRNPENKQLRRLIPEIRRQFEHLCSLRFQDDEIRYLATLGYFKPDFLDYLATVRLEMNHLSLRPDGENIELRLHGPLLQVTIFEIYGLSIINEVHTRAAYPRPDYDTGQRRLFEKIALLQQRGQLDGLRIIDFGTRRRFNRQWQERVLDILNRQIPDYLAGTSNMHLARQLGLPPVGTMAHEWFQAWQAVTPLEYAQRAALSAWLLEYRGCLGIALTDCYSMEAFCRDFKLFFGNLYDGLRHDSGDPIAWGERAIRLYETFDIEPQSKTLVFSDGLTFDKILELYDHFRGRINTGFGIGTNLTNDLGYEPLNIVIKMVTCHGRPVAKISDAPGKSMCEDADYLETLARLYKIDAWQSVSRA
jgi:nicotinate phosphoribosyltransferase